MDGVIERWNMSTIVRETVFFACLEYCKRELKLHLWRINIQYFLSQKTRNNLDSRVVEIWETLPDIQAFRKLSIGTWNLEILSNFQLREDDSFLKTDVLYEGDVLQRRGLTGFEPQLEPA